MKFKLASIALFLFCCLFSQGQDGYIAGRPTIAYWQEGRGLETVILLHGGPAAAHDYLKPEWNALSKSAKVIYYDQRGCGKSEKSDCYHWREHVADLKRVITQVANGRKVVLAGSSWGATLALLYAYSYPIDVKGIILSGTYNWIGKGDRVKECVAYLPANPFTQHPKDTFRYKRLNINGVEEPTREKLIEIHTLSSSFTVNSMVDAPTLQQLKAITQPILIFKGQETCKETPVRDGADLYRSVLLHAEVYTIAGACHDPWLSHTTLFFSKATSFIEQLQQK